MRERLGQILKIACYVLAALLFYQLVRTALRVNPLSSVKIPALPTLDSETNSVAGAPASGPARTGTNAPGTNSLAAGAPNSDSARSKTNSSATNSAVAKTSKEAGTNLTVDVAAKPEDTSAPPSPPEKKRKKVVAPENAADGATNSPSAVTPPKAEMAEQSLISIASTTNITAEVSTNTATTNQPPALAAMGTNTSLAVKAMGTNNVGTNAPSKTKKTNSPPSGAAMAAMSMNPSMMRGGGGGKSELPPEIKARVDKIYESELFGQIMRPQPMALQGIAGNSAILRTASGQTGLVKEGDSLGELKLVRIGINRVLVEQNGQKSELTIFDGYGGESLMPKDKEKETETSK